MQGLPRHGNATKAPDPRRHRQVTVLPAFEVLIFMKIHAEMGPVDTPRLNDTGIRQALIHKLENQAVSPRAIIEELWVHNGKAIADVVALESEAHCYEIKGCTDKVGRILVQGEFYNACFRRITLVTTDRGLPRSLEILPQFWGLMVARIEEDEVRIHEIRKARNNTNFSKHLALLTLWRSEMLDLLQDQSHRRKPREALAGLISSAKGKIELSSRICELLVARQRTPSSERKYRGHVGNVGIHGRLDHGRRSAIAA